MNVEMDTRMNLQRDWEEMCQQYRQNNYPSISGHGDANEWIIDLNDPETRLQSMHNLWRFQKNLPNLGILLWGSFGAVSSLIQEVLVAFWRKDIEGAEATRVVYALSLLETIADHPRTRIEFICSKLHAFVAPLAVQGPTTHFYEVFRRAAMRILYALVSKENVTRGLLTGKEYKCILAQLLTEGFFSHILESVSLYGGIQSQLLAVQIIGHVVEEPEILALFLHAGDNLRITCESLERLHAAFKTESPFLCEEVKNIYNAVLANYKAYLKSKFPIIWANKSSIARQG